MRKIFALFGTVGVQGMSGVKKELSGLDAAIKKAAKEMNKAGRQFQKAGKELIKNITVPVIAATAAVGALAIKTGQYADKLLDLEQITGLSSDKLQEFEHVARVAGVSFDGLVGIISKFTNQLPEIEAGGTAASRAFSKLGVSIRDNSGNVRSMNDLFPEILNKLQGIENVTERNAIAQDVFGRSLTDLAPVLGMTSDKLNSVMQEARDMGLVMSKEDINAANNLRIEMEKVRAQFAAVSREIAASFVPILRDTIAPMVKTTIVPALQDMADRLRKIIAWFGKLSPKTQQMAVKMTIMSAAIGPLLFGLGSMLRSFYSLRLAVLALNAALTANPFGVALVAISALTLGAVSLYNSLKNVNAEKEKQNRLFKEGVEAKYNERVAGALEEVIYFYDKLSKMDKVVIEKEEYDQAVKSIDNLEETLGDAGIAFEGSFGRKAELARQKLKDFTAEAKTAANNIDTSSPSSSGTNIRVSADPDQVAKDEDTIYKLVSQTMDKIRAKRERQARNTKEILEKEKIWRENEADYQAEVAEETARKKEQIEQQYQRSTVRTFRERLAVVKDAYRAEIAAAEEAGAETANIHKYYARQIADIYVDQANSIISNVSMVADQMYDIFNQMARNEEINIDNWSKQQIAAVENSVLSEEE
ncbi:MAG: phage tail tape measure protein, partial [Deltaproteobacteria bacterium]|nr:phage tail tape measure protein [Deltaproteobacteria bacterium]